jgi:TolB-like protein/DNA-binding winged helix-turn-helix (wHTH) protein/Flp pilus assembly protein TadD
MAEEQSVQFGPYRLDPANARLWHATQPIRLTPKAFQVLCYLAARPGQLVSKDELFESVWAETIISEATLTSAIQEIRKALQDNAREPQYVETVPKRGFRFIGEVGSRQEEVVSSQHSVVSSQEAQSLASSVQSLESQGQSLASSAQSLESNTLSVPLDEVQTLDPRRRTLDASVSSPSSTTAPTPRRSRWWQVLVLIIILMLGGGLAANWRLARLVVASYIPPPVPEPIALPLPDKPSIVVLPFTNMSEDPKQEYFSDGMTEDLTSSLSRIPSLFVIARHSAFTYKGKAVKVQEVSREIGVRYVLEGSVRKAGDQLRITAQLIDATTGGHVWSDRYDRQLRDIFALQDEITKQIVAALRFEIDKAELTRVRRVPTENLTAYDFYLRGLESSFRVASETTKEANAHARQMFAKAAELDSTYAEAYVGLSRTYFDDWFYQWANDRAQALEQAFEMAQRAVALDDSLPGAHQLLGHIYVWKKQYEQAIAEGQQAIALDPNDADGYARLGTILTFAGQLEESIGLLEKAMRLNPRSPIFYFNNLGLAYRVAGRYEEAIALLERLLARNPNVMVAHLILTHCYVELGRLDEARAAGVEVMRLNPNWSMEFIRQVPWKDPAIVERNIAALRKAGLK